MVQLELIAEGQSSENCIDNLCGSRGVTTDKQTSGQVNGELLAFAWWHADLHQNIDGQDHYDRCRGTLVIEINQSQPMCSLSC